MRIPGEGTDQLINRREEAQVYHVIQDKKLCDDIEYINRKMVIKSQNFLTTQEFVIQMIKMMCKNV